MNAMFKFIESVYTLIKSCLGRVYRIDCQKFLNGGDVHYAKGLNNTLKSSEIIIVKKNCTKMVRTKYCSLPHIIAGDFKSRHEFWTFWVRIICKINENFN